MIGCSFFSLRDESIQSILSYMDSLWYNCGEEKARCPSAADLCPKS